MLCVFTKFMALALLTITWMNLSPRRWFSIKAEGGEDQVDMGSRITEAIVKLGKHTRRVKILANQGKGFLKSVKMTVIDTYRDVLLPDKKDKEEILVPDSAENDTEIASLMKSLFLQVYDSNYKEFIDVTDSEVLPRRAEIKVEILTYQPHSQAVSELRHKLGGLDININYPLSEARLRDRSYRKGILTVVPEDDYYIWSLMSHSNCGFVKQNGVPSAGVPVDVKAIDGYANSAKVHITSRPVPGYSPKHRITFNGNGNGTYLAINTTDWTVKALATTGAPGYNYDFDFVRLTSHGYEMYYTIHPWSTAHSPTKYLRADGNGNVTCIDLTPTPTTEYIDPGTLFTLYQVD